MLTNLKWIPDWMGKLRIEIYPTYRNIVVAPVIPQSTIDFLPSIRTTVDTYNLADWDNNNAENNIMFDLGFQQLNMPMKNRFKDDLATATCNILPSHIWTCNTQSTDRCQIRLAMNQIRAEMSMALANKYAENQCISQFN